MWKQHRLLSPRMGEVKVTARNEEEQILLPTKEANRFLTYIDAVGDVKPNFVVSSLVGSLVCWVC
jgi:hypothetical protein